MPLLIELGLFLFIYALRPGVAENIPTRPLFWSWCCFVFRPMPAYCIHGSACLSVWYHLAIWSRGLLFDLWKVLRLFEFSMRFCSTSSEGFPSSNPLDLADHLCVHPVGTSWTVAWYGQWPTTTTTAHCKGRCTPATPRSTTPEVSRWSIHRCSWRCQKSVPLRWHLQVFQQPTRVLASSWVVLLTVVGQFLSVEFVHDMLVHSNHHKRFNLINGCNYCSIWSLTIPWEILYLSVITLWQSSKVAGGPFLNDLFLGNS